MLKTVQLLKQSDELKSFLTQKITFLEDKFPRFSPVHAVSQFSTRPFPAS